MNRLLQCFLGLLVAFWLVGAPLTHAVEYTFETIDYPGADSTSIFGINNEGQMVGSYEVGSIRYGFLYDGTLFKPIKVPDASETTPMGINDAGHIVGSYEDATEINTGFLYDGSKYINIAFPGAEETNACGINNNGQIIGLYGGYTFVYDGKNYQDINIPFSFIKNDINNAGQIVGTLLFGAGELAFTYGFLYDGGPYITLYNVGGSNVVFGINDVGQVVGAYGDNFPNLNHIFVDDGTQYHTIDIDGASITLPMDINNAGQIVGLYEDSLGIQHGFLATPIPLPSTILLLGSGLLGLGLLGRRRHQS